MFSQAKKVAVVAAAVATVMSLTACGAGDSQSGASSQSMLEYADLQSALKSDKEITLSVWAWSSATIEPAVQAFEKAYPNIKIDLQGTGTSSDHHVKLKNVLASGKGIPDITQLEYESVPQYAVQGQLLNFGSKSIEENVGKLYNDTAWKAVHVGDGLYGIPQDQGPQVMYYRSDILDQYGIEVPTTWEEFEQAGIKLHKADSSKYLGFIDTSNSRAFVNFYRQAESQPWKVNGLKDIELDMTSGETKKVTEFVQRLIDEGVVEAVPGGTDEFNRAWADGKYATWLDASWRGSIFKTQNADLAGKLRVALPPSWSWDLVSGDGSGSVYSVLAKTAPEKQAAAVAFINWMNSDANAINAFKDIFLAAKAYQSDDSLARQEDEYFGGQRVNEVYFDSAKHMGYLNSLPFNAQFESDFSDVMTPAMKPKGDLNEAMGQWQDKLKTYGNEQGFNVTAK